MKFYIDKNNPEFFFIKEGELIKAAAVIPHDGPATFMYSDSGVSLTHLIKEASEFFCSGKAIVDEYTLMMDKSRLEKVAKFWRPIGSAITKATGAVRKTTEGVNEALRRQMARASSTEFGREFIGGLSQSMYRKANMPHMTNPLNVASSVAGAAIGAGKPQIEAAAMKGLQNLGGWGARAGQQAMPFVKGFSLKPEIAGKLMNKISSIKEFKVKPNNPKWMMDKIGELLTKTKDAYIVVPQIKVAGELEKSEMKLWHQYKSNGDKKALNKLMVSMRPLVKKRVAPWVKNSPLPASAVEAEGMRLLKKAIETYDPSKGAQLKTHAWHGLSKIHRYGYTYQNVGSIPEPRAAKVGSFQNAEEILRDKYNREPTLQELKEELGWGLSDIKAMKEELRRDLVLDDTLGPITVGGSDLGTEALHMVYHDASPQQKLIMEYTFDEFTEKPTIGGSASDVGKKLKMSPAKVRKEYKWIANQLKDFMSDTPILSPA